MSLVAMGVAACATNPVTGGADFVLLSEDQEIDLGRANDPQIRTQFGVYDDPKLQAYVQRVGEELAAKSHRPGLVYRFTVLDSADVNAFALPGGYIYITRGILAYLNSEAEMAAVLGHEIGHVTARHSVRQYSKATAGNIAASIFLRSQVAANLYNLLGSALLQGYGRENELESDRLGAEYLARSGYEPKAMIEVVGVLKNQEEFEKERAKTEGREPRNYHGVFASHPSADKRLQEVVQQAEQYKIGATSRIGRDEYLQHVDGMVFGDSPKIGVRRGPNFYHRDLNFAVRFPKGWHLENSPQAVTARSPERDAVMQLQMQDLNKRMSPEEFAKTRLKLSLKDGGPLAGTDLPSYTGITTIDKTPFGRRTTRVSVVYLDNRAYIFFGTAKADGDFAARDPEFLATARSLHPLKPDEKRFAEGLRLKVTRARPGDTFAKLAQNSPISNYAESIVRLINDKFPTGEPAPGEPIKIIH